MSTAIICIILAVLCFFGVRSTIRRTKYGCCGGGGGEEKKVKVTDKDVSHYPYSSIVEVDGMTCGKCKNRVENAFNSQDGVFASVDLDKRQAVIRMKKQMSGDELKDIVKKAGYMPGAVN